CMQALEFPPITF
nr:immunoglobulin light chain junction region [Macaca mulatta]MOY02479.1 immunoglobulin light chain junction region [Macaca mulatta]